MLFQLWKTCPTRTSRKGERHEYSSYRSTKRELKPRIVVFGIGGAGGNAVNNMVSAGLEGVDFVVANTDAQALAASQPIAEFRWAASSLKDWVPAQIRSRPSGRRGVDG